MRPHSFRYRLDNPSLFRTKALHWASQFSHCTYFNHNNVRNYPYGPFREMMMVGAAEVLTFNTSDHFTELKRYCQDTNDWLIGFLSYDLKNQIESLKSSHVDHVDFPEINFYVPQHFMFFDGDDVYIESHDEPKSIYEEICHTNLPDTVTTTPKIQLTASTNRDIYIKTVNQLKDHILEGDIYEINYCMGFYGCAAVDPVQIYRSLTTLSPTPFSVFHKFGSKYLICASPERFMKKQHHKLISQPIKGTARRGNSPYEDEKIKQNLRTDEKELAENMMIVDLVRNDLARSSKPGSVKVEEMFGIYTFRQLHQMISTVTSEIREDVHFIDAIKNAFPMGSMTGAPKIKVMELIEKYENTKRGLYSGTIGYISPEGDFDFNVVIRSILYNEKNQKLSFQVGSAITFDADPEKEYDECMLKASAIIETLNTSSENNAI